jgi:hypothetical protein
MIPFEEVICQLILRHNCVVLPNFGGFVAKTVSAQIDFEKGIFQAPYKQLLFNRNLINDDGLVHLKPLIQLSHLDLDHTQISDAGITILKAMPNLSVLNLFRTKITRQGFEELKKHLPGCMIEGD